MVCLSIIICTYNRQEMVKSNISLLKTQCKRFIHHVYVIDNGSNLPLNLTDNFVSILYNKNLGGSGGYARGLYEARKDKTCTHIMLMDDDIKFDPHTLEKAIEKLKKMNNKDWLSFAMRTFEEPDKICENTALWSGIVRKSNNKCSCSNIKCPHKKAPKYNYAAWWSLIMPISVVDRYGYPMPFFIKSDDIEYGLRRRGDKILFDNSISVLHEDFSKKISEPFYYYNIRNYLITNILHFKHSFVKCFLMFSLRMGKAWLTCDFSKLELSLLGFKDFLKGPSLLKNVDLEENNNRIKKTSMNIKFNLLKFIIYPMIVLYYTFLLMLSHCKLKQEYDKEFLYLTSEKFWEKQFKKKLPN